MRGIGSTLRIGILLALAACTGGDAFLPPEEAPLNLPPDDYVLPARDTVLDPARLSEGTPIATRCDAGSQLVSRDEWGLVDVFFNSEGGHGPAEADLDVVRAQGGRVLYSFNVPAVRARVYLSRIPSLFRSGRVAHVLDVPDPTRYDVRISTGFSRPLTDADPELFPALGGRMTSRFQSLNAMYGILPDASIPNARAWPGVSRLNVSGFFCTS